MPGKLKKANGNLFGGVIHNKLAHLHWMPVVSFDSLDTGSLDLQVSGGDSRTRTWDGINLFFSSFEILKFLKN